MTLPLLPVAARWERGPFSEFCLVPAAVHDNDGRSCNGLRGLFVYWQAIQHGAINCPLPRARRHPEPTFDFLCRQLSSAAMSSMASGTGLRGRVTDQWAVCVCCAGRAGKKPGRWRRSRPRDWKGCGRRARDHGVARFIEPVEQARLRASLISWTAAWEARCHRGERRRTPGSGSWVGWLADKIENHYHSQRN